MPDRTPSRHSAPGHDVPPAGFAARDERRHDDAPVEEWWFSCWGADGSFGLVSGFRIVGPRAWYWASLSRPDEPLVHMTEFDVPRRADPLLAKAPEMWAEHSCVAPFDQWTVGNEMYAAALDDPDEALGRAYGMPTPFAMDLEWYATSPAVARNGAARTGGTPGETWAGYEQRGVVHGAIELPSGPVELDEVPASRWHRWGASMGPLPLPVATAHLGLRSPFRFPDGSTADLVLTSQGWHVRNGGG